MGRPQSPGSPFRILWDAINEVNKLSSKYGDLEGFKAGAELTRRASEYSEKQGNNRHSDSKRYAVPEKNGASVPPNNGYTVPTRNEGKNDRKDMNEKGNPPTPLTAYGNQNPYGAFEAQLDGKPERIAEHWAMAYKHEYRARPAIGNYEKKIILEDLAEYDENALKLAFKAFLADKWHRDNKRHSLKVFAADPTKWLNPAIAEVNKPYDIGNDDEYWAKKAREEQIASAATLSRVSRADLDAELERLTSYD